MKAPSGKKWGTPRKMRGIKMKRFLSILLAILMLAVMLPVTAMAEETVLTELVYS